MNSRWTKNVYVRCKTVSRKKIWHYIHKYEAETNFFKGRYKNDHKTKIEKWGLIKIPDQENLSIRKSQYTQRTSKKSIKSDFTKEDTQISLGMYISI
jgi:hypothetical protein